MAESYISIYHNMYSVSHASRGCFGNIFLHSCVVSVRRTPPLHFAYDTVAVILKTRWTSFRSQDAQPLLCFPAVPSAQPQSELCDHKECVLDFVPWRSHGWSKQAENAPGNCCVYGRPVHLLSERSFISKKLRQYILCSVLKSYNLITFLFQICLGK